MATRSPSLRSRTWHTAPRRTRSSRRSRRTRRAASTLAASPASNPIGRLSASTAGAESALISEDGALEIGRGGFSIEPFIVSGSRLITLGRRHHDPIAVGRLSAVPSVTWQHPEWSMRDHGLCPWHARCRRARGALHGDATSATAPQSLQLVLAARPFQVNPPTQFLNITGGVSAIRSLDWDGTKLSVNGQPKVVPLIAPDRFSASRLRIRQLS